MLTTASFTHKIPYSLSCFAVSRGAQKIGADEHLGDVTTSLNFLAFPFPYALKLSRFNNISIMNIPLVSKDDQFLQSLPLKHVHLCNAALYLIHVY